MRAETFASVSQVLGSPVSMATLCWIFCPGLLSSWTECICMHFYLVWFIPTQWWDRAFWDHMYQVSKPLFEIIDYHIQRKNTLFSQSRKVFPSQPSRTLHCSHLPCFLLYAATAALLASGDTSASSSSSDFPTLPMSGKCIWESQSWTLNSHSQRNAPYFHCILRFL